MPDNEIPILANIPHSSLIIPEEIRKSLLINDEQLDRELLLLTDRYTDELFSVISELGGIVMAYKYSRLVADPERFEDDSRELMAKKGMGIIYIRTSGGKPLRAPLSTAEREKVLEAFVRPYHRAVELKVQELLDRFGRCLILDCHSFSSIALPFEFDQSFGRPDICIGTDDYHSPEILSQTVEAFCTKTHLKILRNKPYVGSYVPLKYWGKDRRVSSLMIEIRRGLYMDEGTGSKVNSFIKTKDLITQLVLSIVRIFPQVPLVAKIDGAMKQPRDNFDNPNNFSQREK